MPQVKQFADRQEAGKRLAKVVAASVDPKAAVVLALPRGGVPVGYEIAKTLAIPLDVLVVRKLGFPGHEEYAVGALAEGGTRVTNEELLERIPKRDWSQVLAKEQLELERRISTYREGREIPSLQGKTVILVDDGLATGATMLAAVKAVKQKRPRRVVVAAPVGAKDTCQQVLSEVDEVICLRMPEPFYGVGSWYRSFPQTSDEQVVSMLDEVRSGVL